MSVLDLALANEDALADRLFEAYRDGVSKRQLARQFNISARDVDRLLLTRVCEYRPEDRALSAYADVVDIDEMLRKLRTLARETDDPRTLCEVTLAWNKLCVTKVEILGTAAPRQVQGTLNVVEAAPKQTSTQKIREIVERVAATHPSRPLAPGGEDDGPLN
jgi:hypothetical protein